MKELFDANERLTQPEPHLPSQQEFFQIFSHPSLNRALEFHQARIEIATEPGIIQAQIGDWFLYRLRDRRDDGQNQPLESNLVDWYYGNPIDQVQIPAVEESTYWLSPDSLIKNHLPQDLAEFITNPFAALPDSDDVSALIEWHNQWQRAVHGELNLLPGQYSYNKLPGLRRHIDTQSSQILKCKGYHLLTAVPTWYHTAKLYEHLGYSYTHSADQQSMYILGHHLDQLTSNPIKQSWIVMRQFWAAAVERNNLVPEVLAGDKQIIRDSNNQLLFYPLSPERNLWMQKQV